MSEVVHTAVDEQDIVHGGAVHAAGHDGGQAARLRTALFSNRADAVNHGAEGSKLVGEQLLVLGGAAALRKVNKLQLLEDDLLLVHQDRVIEDSYSSTGVVRVVVLLSNLEASLKTRMHLVSNRREGIIQAVQGDLDDDESSSRKTETLTGLSEQWSARASKRQ